MEERLFFDLCPSPIGELLLTSNDEGLTGLYLSTPGRPAVEPGWTREGLICRTAREQLEAYLAGKLRTFNVPLCLRGTAFQLRVWQELQAIPFGSTASYAEVARRLGQPTASRAVGAANGQNQVAIIVPCHRVIAADGTLGGYGGGLERKRWLLQHEAKLLTHGQGTLPFPLQEPVRRTLRLDSSVTCQCRSG